MACETLSRAFLYYVNPLSRTTWEAYCVQLFGGQCDNDTYGRVTSVNRYSYCLNNALIYQDNNGEFFSAIVGFWKGILKGKDPLKKV